MGLVKLLGHSSQNDYYANLNRIIEIAGRTCYLSQDEITQSSAGDFIKKILKINKHESVGGHSYFNVLISFVDLSDAYRCAYDIVHTARGNIQVDIENFSLLVGGNWRSFKQLYDSGTLIGEYLYLIVGIGANNTTLFFDLGELDDYNDSNVKGLYNIRKYVFNPRLYVYNKEVMRRYSYATFSFTQYNRAFSHQLIRHMGVWLKNSFSEMSQRYVDPTKKNIKSLYSIPIPVIRANEAAYYRDSVDMAIGKYNIMKQKMWLVKSQLKNEFAKPEEVARDLLPNAINTEIVMSGTIESWLHFIKMRTSGKAQYHIREAANQVENILIRNFNKQLIKENDDG